MRYLLLNKNHLVLVFEFDENFNIGRICEELATDYTPYGLCFKGHIDLLRLNSWWSRRSIPASRRNLDFLLERCGLGNNLELIARSYGLSLSDHYWIKPEVLDVAWEDVNYFDNDFTEDIGKILFEGTESHNINFNSPDNTSEGNLPKCWKIIAGKRFLVKKGAAPYYQEPFNEVIAAEIGVRLGIPCARTILVRDGDDFCSASENFITRNTELVSAWQLLASRKKPNHLNNYQLLKEIAVQEGISDFDQGISSMLVLDYILNNEDRHFRNFGFIRNVETLQFEGMAPLFDNGACLWYTNLDQHIGARREVKPFDSNGDKQIHYITSADHLHFEVLGDLSSIFQVLGKNPLVSRGRISLLREGVQGRIEYLRSILGV